MDGIVIVGRSKGSVMRAAWAFAVLATFAVDDLAVVAAFAEHEAKGISAFKMDDGTFVDYPVVDRARAVLRDAGA